MRPFERFYKKNTSSEKVWAQIFGALAKRWWLSFLLLVCAILSAISLLAPCNCASCGCGAWCKFIKMAPWNKAIWLTGLTALWFTANSVCNTLTDINSLLRNENRITWSQIGKLIAAGIWLIGLVLIIDIKENANLAAAVGIFSAILTWVFQDRVKGVAAFISLRKRHMLNIGDWIKVPKLDVDGEIKRVTLTSVTLSNWDTTISTIPISALQDGHFVNLQNMSMGKTYGRRMLKSFVLDTGCIRPVSENELESIKSGNHGIKEYIPEDELKPGALNAHLFRLYTYHWMMKHPHVSQLPRLIVRWMDPQESGMPLQVYAFITDSNLTAFEWQQSQIIEHILVSLEWFGLRLYQSPSAKDVSKSIIHIDNPEIFKQEGK